MMQLRVSLQVPAPAGGRVGWGWDPGVPFRPHLKRGLGEKGKRRGKRAS